MASDARRSHHAQGLRILVVEDEMLIALHLEGLLEELGHTVVAIAARIERALELVGRHAIDLAILDVNLAGQESYPVADALAARKVPFVFVTGYEKARLRAPYDSSPVLQKPYTSRELQRTLADIRPSSPGGVTNAGTARRADVSPREG